MLLSVITPEKVEWMGEAESVNLPSVVGEITILPGHVEMVCALKAGEMRIMNEGKEFDLYISDGTAQIKSDGVTILTEEALKATDVTTAQVEEARRAAITAKNNKVDDFEFANLEANLKRELAKEKIMQNYRKKIKNVG